MNFPRTCVTLTCSLFVFAASIYAADPAPSGPAAPAETKALLPESDDDIPVEIIPRYDNAVSFGFKRVNKGPKVKFGNLGTVIDALYSTTDGSRIYSNGTITADSASTGEIDSVTTVQALDNTEGTNTAGYKYKVVNGIVTVYDSIAYYDSSDGTTLLDGVPTSIFRQYAAGQTRTWSYVSSSQLGVDADDPTKRTVAMSVYGAVSDGGSATAESNSSVGFDLQFEHRIGKIGKRFEWGIAGGFGLSDIKAQTAAVVKSKLYTRTDYYHIIQTTQNATDYTSGAAIPTSQPSGSAVDITYNYTAVDGSAATQTTASGDTSGSYPLELTPYKEGEVAVGEALVSGVWSIKGSYYNLRLGPKFRFRFNEKLAISGSAGFALGWVGTVFKAEETIINVETTSVLSVTEENETHKFVPGWYGELNAEWWLTERTGFYGGVTYQGMKDFTQRPLSGRTAKIDLGSSAGFQFGIITRF